jgi:hypothetical protein
MYDMLDRKEWEKLVQAFIYLKPLFEEIEKAKGPNLNKRMENALLSKDILKARACLNQLAFWKIQKQFLNFKKDTWQDMDYLESAYKRAYFNYLLISSEVSPPLFSQNQLIKKNFKSLYYTLFRKSSSPFSESKTIEKTSIDRRNIIAVIQDIEDSVKEIWPETKEIPAPSIP